MKLILAGVLLVLVPITLVLNYVPGAGSKVLLIFYVLRFFTVVGLGYFGGQLVYASQGQAPPNSYRAGEQVYANSCGGCHPNGRNVINPKFPVKNSDKLANFTTFLNWIRSPKAPMPPFPVQSVSDQKAQELYQYIVNVIDKPGGK